MKITRMSPFTRKKVTIDLPITESQYSAWEGGALAQAHGGTKTAFGVHLAIEIADESIPGTRRLVLRLLSGHFGSKEDP